MLRGDGGRTMFVWLIRRLLQAAVVVLVMTIIVFVGLHLIGNPVDVLISPEAGPAGAASGQRIP